MFEEKEHSVCELELWAEFKNRQRVAVLRCVAADVGHSYKVGGARNLNQASWTFCLSAATTTHTGGGGRRVLMRGALVIAIPRST